MMMNPLLGPEAGPIGKARSPSVKDVENASKNRRFEDVLAAGEKSATQVPDPEVAQEQPGDSPAQAKPGEVAAKEEGRSVKGAETGSDAVSQSDIEASGHAEFAGRTSTVAVRSAGSSIENAKPLGETHVEQGADRLEDARLVAGAETAVRVSSSSQTPRTERGGPEATDTAEAAVSAFESSLNRLLPSLSIILKWACMPLPASSENGFAINVAFNLNFLAQFFIDLFIKKAWSAIRRGSS